MLIYKKEYDLPDYSIITTEKLVDFKLWQPETTYIVLGKSDTIEKSINRKNKNNIEEKIYVVKRPSGGHTVILSPKTIVISIISKNVELKSKQIFGGVNKIIISALKKLQIENLSETGISDIAIKNKKILGSSIYKNKNYYFYHAVLNFSEQAEKINSWLLHPMSEPSYRQQRSHIDFITSIYSHNNKLTIRQTMDCLQNEFSEQLNIEYLMSINNM